MTTKETTNALRELDICRALFESLEYILEHNHSVKDFHSLAMLAQDGKDRLDSAIDVLTG